MALAWVCITIHVGRESGNVKATSTQCCYKQDFSGTWNVKFKRVAGYHYWCHCSLRAVSASAPSMTGGKIQTPSQLEDGTAEYRESNDNPACASFWLPASQTGQVRSASGKRRRLRQLTIVSTMQAVETNHQFASAVSSSPAERQQGSLSKSITWPCNALFSRFPVFSTFVAASGVTATGLLLS
jgi:hypothetical protein